MSDATVSAAYAKALFDLAVAKGADAGRLLSEASLAEDSFSDPDARIPFEAFKRLMRAGKRLSNEPALALHFGALPFETLSIVGMICYAAPNMAEAFRQMNRFGRLVIEVEGVGAEDRFQIVRRKNGVWINDMRKNPNSFPELTESTLGRFICGYREGFPGKEYVLSAHVPHPAPNYAAEYERILKVPVVFGSDRNAMQIDEELLNIRLSDKNTYVFGVLNKHADALIKALEKTKTLKARIEQQLIPILHTGDATMEQTAKELGMSRQTLYRRLKSEGASFEVVLDDLRRTMALHYLSGEKVSVNETAYLVGFSDPSSFSRAFKRWTGKSPGQTRANALSGQ